MKPGAISLAFSWYSGSKRRKVNLAISGTFERNDMTSTPSGARSPVETSSSTTMVTVHSKESGSSGTSGGGFMFGPRKISMPDASSGDAGARIWRSSTAGFAGASGRFGYSPSSRASVMAPRRAVATAVVGLVRYTWSVMVPERPGKLRLKVLTLTASDGGAWPIPTHGPHTGSSIRAPARTRSEYTPVWAIASRICLLPGVTVMTSPGYTVWSLKTAAATARSSKPELTELPMQTWAALVPATSLTGTTLPGEWGWAMRGSSSSSAMCSYSSYSAPSSAPSSTKSSGRCWASSHSRVLSSEGKMAVVAPVSVLMLQIEVRPVTGMVATPGP